MSKRRVLFPFFVLVTMLTPVLSADPQETPERQQAPAYRFREEAEIESVLEQVFQAPEYRRLGRPEPAEEEAESPLPRWLERLLDWLVEWLASLFSSSTEEEGTVLELPHLIWLRWAVYVLVIAILTAVVALIVKAILQYASRDKPTEPQDATATAQKETPPGEHPSNEYLRRALAFGEAADYKAAIRQLLLGTMSWIERHNLIRYRRGLSNRDYVRAVSARPSLRESLSRIVLHFEHVYFGRRAASAQGFRECLQHFQRGFEAD